MEDNMKLNQTQNFNIFQGHQYICTTGRAALSPCWLRKHSSLKRRFWLDQFLYHPLLLLKPDFSVFLHGYQPLMQWVSKSTYTGGWLCGIVSWWLNTNQDT